MFSTKTIYHVLRIYKSGHIFDKYYNLFLDIQGGCRYFVLKRSGLSIISFKMLKFMII